MFKSLLIASLEDDAHSVGMHILKDALSFNKYDVLYLGNDCSLNEIFEYAVLVDAVMISTLNGHALLNLDTFQKKKELFEINYGRKLWYIGGNLCINEDPSVVENQLLAMGFTRAYVKFTSVDNILEDLQKDWKSNIIPTPKFIGKLNYPLKTHEIISNNKIENNFFPRFFSQVKNQWKKSENINLDIIFKGQEKVCKRYSDVHGIVNENPLIQPRTGVTSLKEQMFLWDKLRPFSDCLSIQVDSKTRKHYFVNLDNILDEGNNSALKLNGFPAVNHGLNKCQQLVEKFIDTPLQVRHGSADGRLLAAITLGAGFSSFEGGAISYNFPYFKNIHLSKSIRHWQEVDRLAGICCENGFVIDREFFGTLTGTLIEPSIAIVVNILEALLAAKQGVNHMSLGYAEQGNRLQDIAAVQVLKELADYYLFHNGFKVTTKVVFNQFMAAFPSDSSLSKLLIKESAITAKLAKADRIIIKTPIEAVDIPDYEMNIYASKIVNLGFSEAKNFELNENELINEKKLIRLQVKQIMSSILNLNRENLAEAIIIGFSKGYLDIPFSPSLFNKGKVRTIRDTDGKIRFLSVGNLQLSKDIKNFHKKCVITRKKLEKLEDHQMIEKDVTIIAQNKIKKWPLDNYVESTMEIKASLNHKVG